MEHPLLNQLNAAQQQAVSAPLDHCLVLAGAGSGKTRVLVHRIAWLMQQHQVSPWGILAVTFTNKAAAEMRGRVESLLNLPASGMWIGTFHGLAHRLLRSHYEAAKLPENFQVIDADDQHRLLKRLQRSLGIDEERWPPKKTQWFISHQKERGLRSQHIQSDGQLYLETMLTIYRAYEALCERSGLVDFSELLLRAHELWLHNDDLLQHYRSRFGHILVDEFQDTNALQYAWIRLLAGNSGKVMVVGDDDQSIYSWRGALVENIHSFQKDYQQPLLIRLEQNYRSTQTILDAANAIIEHNSNRMGKKLWSGGDKGEPIGLYKAYSEQDEAQFIINQAKQWFEKGNSYREVAVLYRSNAQSRVIEEALLRANIQYQVYGGQQFFERAEIKDVLAYCRMVVNPHDDSSLDRIINVPTRGIGQTTLAAIRLWARDHASSLWDALQSSSQIDSLSARAKSALQQFIMLIQSMTDMIIEKDLGDQMACIVEQSGLIEHHQKDRTEKGLSRLENIDELVSAAREFTADPEQNLPPMSAFLTSASLEAGEGQSQDHANSVQLMTLHAAKGLEFPLVLMVGLEENLFPHQMSMEDQGLEEERRLCYVGMTRAMKQLFLTHAEKRRLHGREHYHRPSRFLDEIPQELLNDLRPKPKVQWANPYTPSTTHHDTGFDSHFDTEHHDDHDGEGMHLGQRVQHQHFGEGVITQMDGHGSHARVQVKFKRHGSKWLLAEMAKLEPVVV